MNPVWHENLAAVQEKHPHLLPVINEPLPEGAVLSLQERNGRIVNVRFLTPDGGETMLYPEDDSLEDISMIREKFGRERGKVVCVFGLGPGLSAHALLDAVGKSNVVVFFEAFGALLKEGMRRIDLAPVFRHPNARFVVEDAVDPEGFLCQERDRLFAGNGHLTIDFKAITALSPQWYAASREKMARWVLGKRIAAAGVGAKGLGTARNRFDNLPAMSESIPLGSLEKRFSGIPAIIVASGPSLSKNIGQLAAAKGKALILAADSAVAPLLAHDIVPDLVVSVDINAFTFEKLAPFADRLKETGLLFIPEVTPKIPNHIAFAFKVFTLLDPHSAPFFNRLLGVCEPPLRYAQSVVHLALGAAQTMGCDPVIFTGLDLAFDNGVDHAEGTILHWGNCQAGDGSMVESVFGKMIPTNVGLLNIRETCEILMRSVPDRTYIDATEGGAKKAHTRVMPLAEAIQTSCKKPVDKTWAQRREGAGRGLSDRLESAAQDVLRLEELCGQHAGHAARIETCLQELDSGMLSPDKFWENTRLEWAECDAVTTRMNGDALIATLTDLFAASVDEYREHEILKAEAEASGDPVARYRVLFSQQRFIRELRGEKLSFLKENIDRMRSFFSDTAALETKISESPDDAAVSLGNLYFRYGLFSRAESVLKPFSSDEAAFLKGRICFHQGKVEQGLSLLKALRAGGRLSSERETELLTDAENTWLAACTPNAPWTFRKVVADRLLMLPGPGSPGVLQLVLEVAAYFAQTGDGPQAGELLEKALQTRFLGHPGIMEQRVRLYFQMGDFDNGLILLEAAVAKHADLARLWEEIGDTLSTEKDYEGALVAYGKYCLAMPGQPGIHRKMGDCCVALGRVAEAASAYRAAVSGASDVGS